MGVAGDVREQVEGDLVAAAGQQHEDALGLLDRGPAGHRRPQLADLGLAGPVPFGRRAGRWHSVMSMARPSTAVTSRRRRPSGSPTRTTSRSCPSARMMRSGPGQGAVTDRGQGVVLWWKQFCATQRRSASEPGWRLAPRLDRRERSLPGLMVIASGRRDGQRGLSQSDTSLFAERMRTVFHACSSAKHVIAAPVVQRSGSALAAWQGEPALSSQRSSDASRRDHRGGIGAAVAR